MSLPSRPLFFVIDLNRFQDDLDKVSHLIESKYKRDMDLERQDITFA